MKLRHPLLAVLVLLLAAVGCSRTSLPETLRAEIERYRQGEAAPGAAEHIEALFAELDAEIARLRADAAVRQGEERAKREQEAEALGAESRALHADYLAARIARAGSAAGDALRSAGQAIGEQLEDAGRKLRESSAAPREE
jgi:hypothetical protein